MAAAARPAARIRTNPTPRPTTCRRRPAAPRNLSRSTASRTRGPAARSAGRRLLELLELALCGGRGAEEDVGDDRDLRRAPLPELALARLAQLDDVGRTMRARAREFRLADGGLAE